MTESEKIENLLKAFYENHGSLRGYVFACTRSYHGTEEVMQSTAIKIAQSAATFDAERPTVPWFLGIVKNQIRQWFDKNKTQTRFVSFDAIDEHLQQFEIFRTDQVSPRLSALDRCMQRLPGHQRKVVQLRYADNRSCSEIAASLGKSNHSIYSILKRLKVGLRKCIEIQLKESALS